MVPSQSQFLQFEKMLGIYTWSMERHQSCMVQHMAGYSTALAPAISLLVSARLIDIISLTLN